MKMRSESILLCFLLIFPLFDCIGSAAPSVEQLCNSEFTKVGSCLNFATGKAASPAEQCCSAASDIRDRNPVCLCYIIQQTHKGEATLKQMGLQEEKLLQLPSACKLKNASVSDCPKLLKLSPSSPDYAIFTSSSNSSSAADTSNPTTGTPKPTNSDGSNGFMHGPHLAGLTAITVAVLVFNFVFPTGLIFVFHTGA